MKWKPDEIKALRENLSLSQREFAEKLGVSRNLIWYWESGQKIPVEGVVERIAPSRRFPEAVSKKEEVA